MFARLEPQLAIITAIVSVVALVCAAIIAEGLKAGRQCAGDEALAQKIRTYEALLHHCTKSTGREVNEDQMYADGKVTLEELLALQGGSKVVAVYLELQNAIRQDGALRDGKLLYDLLLAMRRDLGYSEAVGDTSVVTALLFRSYRQAELDGEEQS